MKIPVDRKYSETHEWFLLEDDTATMGITQYAADELTDITYVDLPEVGAKVSTGDAIAEVESVKATSEIFAAIPGTVTAVNTALTDHPELINDDAFDEGWMIKIKVDSNASLENLMTAKDYASFLRNSA
ncbi:MAG: glycine cleavage system protein GcvH [Planctomycetes bacterium]|nr:glycine cleavage system protein GcvH [Planctomycetota bacterium]MBI3835474.1 glycine cleavage system protein GcvH [Planctomycetota bacterium]